MRYAIFVLLACSFANAKSAYTAKLVGTGAPQFSLIELDGYAVEEAEGEITAIETEGFQFKDKKGNVGRFLYRLPGKERIDRKFGDFVSLSRKSIVQGASIGFELNITEGGRLLLHAVARPLDAAVKSEIFPFKATTGEASDIELSQDESKSTVRAKTSSGTFWDIPVEVRINVDKKLLEDKSLKPGEFIETRISGKKFITYIARSESRTDRPASAEGTSHSLEYFIVRKSDLRAKVPR